jgi:hypothetical protein
MQVKGTVEAISTKFGKYGVLVNEQWYSTKPEWIDPKPQKGDVIEFDSGGDGKRYLTKCKIVSTGGEAVQGGSVNTGGAANTSGKSFSRGAFPIDPLDGTRSIIRQNAVTNANTYLASNGSGNSSIEDLLNTARKIEAYTSGDLDAEEAKAAMAAMNSSEG